MRRFVTEDLHGDPVVRTVLKHHLKQPTAKTAVRLVYLSSFSRYVNKIGPDSQTLCVYAAFTFKRRRGKNDS